VFGEISPAGEKKLLQNTGFDPPPPPLDPPYIPPIQEGWGLFRILPEVYPIYANIERSFKD